MECRWTTKDCIDYNVAAAEKHSDCLDAKFKALMTRYLGPRHPAMSWRAAVVSFHNGYLGGNEGGPLGERRPLRSSHVIPIIQIVLCQRRSHNTAFAVNRT